MAEVVERLTKIANSWLENDTLKKLAEKTQIGTIELPSILTQLRQKHKLRWRLDMTILKIFGYNEKDANKILEQIYELLSEEITRLKIFMKGN